MPQVSENRLDKQVWLKVWQHFIVAFESAHEQQKLEFLFSKILTKTEKVMLAKRITLGALLAQGWPVRDIALTLHLSNSTIYKFQALQEIDQGYTQFFMRLVSDGKTKTRRKKSKQNVIFSEFNELLEDLFVSYRHRSRAYYGRES